jgi:hypothetical protein
MKGFAARLLWAIQGLERREQKRKVENAEIGRRVAEGLGRTPAYRSQTVGKWLEGSEPSSEVVAMLARVLDVDPGWLAFGSLSQAPAPKGWTAPPTSAGQGEELTAAEARDMTVDLPPQHHRQSPAETPPAMAPGTRRPHRKGA